MVKEYTHTHIYIHIKLRDRKHRSRVRACVSKCKCVKTRKTKKEIKRTRTFIHILKGEVACIPCSKLKKKRREPRKYERKTNTYRGIHWRQKVRSGVSYEESMRFIMFALSLFAVRISLWRHSFTHSLARIFAFATFSFY